jgi:hypothetical protein
VTPDAFLARDPDVPVFGINLACAYPFAGGAAQWYQPIARRLAALDPAVYVYPEWETHVTLLTFVNFSLHQRPDPLRLAQLQSLLPPLLAVLTRLFASRPTRAFRLVLGAPVLTRKAAIIPISDPAGEVTRLRREVRQALQADAALHGELLRRGFNVPGIIHSTILRFKAAPANLPRFLAEFDAAAAAAPVELGIEELLLTSETKPYMRDGALLHRFPLAPAGN